MRKTAEHIVVELINGRKQKKTIYVDENGTKYVYNQNGFWKLEEFIKNRKVV